MTNITLQAPKQTPRFEGTISNLLMAATVILTGFLSLAMFAS
ncbi:MAG TPA: hypothetical protein VIJ85_12920 [Rhizomicrobium sp.]